MKKLISLVVVCLALVVLVAPAFAKGPSKPAGKSDTAHLYFYQKCADDNTCGWDDSSTWGDAWGKMKYKTTGPEFDFVFNGHGLVPDEQYILIYYPDPWPGDDLICLGEGTANNGGNVNINASFATGDLPTEDDWNHEDNDDKCNEDTNEGCEPPGPGAKIWLITSADANCHDEDGAVRMVDWHPGSYLFEEVLINFDQVE